MTYVVDLLLTPTLLQNVFKHGWQVLLGMVVESKIPKLLILIRI